MIRFRRILCPVDFSPGSLKAFNYALKLAANYDAQIHLLHVESPVIPAAYGAYSSLETTSLLVDLQKAAARQLQKLEAKAAKSGISVRTEVRTGFVDVEISRAVESRKADLVVMGTHGLRGFQRWMIGSVTERLMRHCPVPLLTISSADKVRMAPPAIRNILVTTDFSVGTSEALEYAFSIAQECQSKIELLHIVDDASFDLSSKVREPLIEEVREKLEAMVPKEARAWCKIETRVDTGTPYREILDILHSEKIQLLVMNVHGKGMLARALVGSTAERIVRVAECPVLLIPPMPKARRKVKSGKAA